MKPLVVYSKADLRHTTALMHHSDLLDFAELNSVPVGNWPVAYMRCAHYTWGDELESAARVENRLRSNGTRIVNSIENRIRCQRKDYYYPILQRDGIPIPTFIHHPTIEEIRYLTVKDMSWPFIYRSADGSRGRDAYLVHNEQEFHEADTALIAKGRRRIAVKLIDSRDKNGKYFIRRRAFVIFGVIDMWMSDISGTWNTQSDEADREVGDLIRENKIFSPPACRSVVRRHLLA